MRRTDRDRDRRRCAHRTQTKPCGSLRTSNRAVLCKPCVRSKNSNTGCPIEAVRTEGSAVACAKAAPGIAQARHNAMIGPQGNCRMKYSTTRTPCLCTPFAIKEPIHGPTLAPCQRAGQSGGCQARMSTIAAAAAAGGCAFSPLRKKKGTGMARPFDRAWRTAFYRPIACSAGT